MDTIAENIKSLGRSSLQLQLLHSPSMPDEFALLINRKKLNPIQGEIFIACN